MDTHHVRSATVADAGDVADLCRDLGYDIGVDEVREALADVASDEHHAALVAVADDRTIVGWVHVHETRLLVSPRRADVGGLVVARRCRRQGIGRLLMIAAEDWACSRGYEAVRLRSNVTRTDAHRFYEALGYHTSKTSRVFEKRIRPAADT